MVCKRSICYQRHIGSEKQCKHVVDWYHRLRLVCRSVLSGQSLCRRHADGVLHTHEHYGWMYWGAKKQLHPIQRTKMTNFVSFIAAAVLATLAYGWLLHEMTDAYAPFIDSIVLMFSVLAQFLLMKRRLETWVCWLIVDTVAVPLYFSRELYLTAFVYGLFWCNAWYGLYSWIKIYRSENKGEKTWQQSPLSAD